jgi:type I restriction enzyme, S subunit
LHDAARLENGETWSSLPDNAWLRFSSKDWSEHGIPVLKIKNIVGDTTVNLSSVDHVSHDLLTPKLEKFLIRNGDIVVAMTGATAGKVGRVATSPDAMVLLNQRVAKIEPVDVDPEFIWAVVSSEEYQKRFFHLANGAAQPNMSGGQIESVELLLPSIREQRRAGQIILTYDKLLEVNRQRVAILEEMARGLFQEWFPGHERQPTLPKGWQWGTLGTLCSEIRDAVSPADLEGDTPYVGLEHLPRRSTTLDSWGRADQVKSTKLRFRAGDVLFGKIRPYFHKVVFAPFDGVSSSDAIVVRSHKPEFRGLVLSVASSDSFVAHAVATSNGTKMPRANWSVLARTPVPLPPELLMCRFNRFVISGAELAASLHSANMRLVACRDLLLPRLISGELSVAAVERELENAA